MTTRVDGNHDIRGRHLVIRSSLSGSSSSRLRSSPEGGNRGFVAVEPSVNR